MSTELALHNKKIPDLNPDLSKTKIPRVWGNLREDLGNLRDQINEDLTKNVQNHKISAKPKILSLFNTRASHYHHEIGFFLQFLKLVLIQNVALPKSKKHGN